MKKIKYIALVLVLMLGLIGGAYAYWQQTLIFDGTVETGYMNVEWVRFQVRDDGTQYADSIPEYVTVYAHIDSADPKRAVLTIENLYPTDLDNPERVAIQGFIQNKSSIPVRFESASLIIDSDEDGMLDYMYVDVIMGKRDSPTGPWNPYTGSQVGGTFPSVTMPLSELDGWLDDTLEGEVFIPGAQLTFGDETLYFYMVGDAPQNSKLKFTLEFNWIQWNAP